MQAPQERQLIELPIPMQCFHCHQTKANVIRIAN